jgi:hypothetical protein
MSALAWLSISSGHDSEMEREMLISLARFSFATNPEKLSVRQYSGWHHHMLTTMLAHCFLWQLKIRVGEKSACTDGVATAEVVRGGLTPTHLSH